MLCKQKQIIILFYFQLFFKLVFIKTNKFQFISFNKKQTLFVFYRYGFVFVCCANKNKSFPFLFKKQKRFFTSFSKLFFLNFFFVFFNNFALIFFYFQQNFAIFYKKKQKFCQFLFSIFSLYALFSKKSLKHIFWFFCRTGAPPVSGRDFIFRFSNVLSCILFAFNYYNTFFFYTFSIFFYTFSSFSIPFPFFSIPFHVSSNHSQSYSFWFILALPNDHI